VRMLQIALEALSQL